MADTTTLDIGSGVDIALIDVDLIDTNSWNPNTMSDTVFNVLKKKITDTQVMRQPILAFKKDGRYVISDGEHRFLAAKAAGLKSVPVVVVPMEEAEAKIETIAMNNLRGEYIPIKMAELIASLKDTYSEEQIRALTGMEKDEVASLSALLEVGDFSFESSPIIAPEHKETPIAVHLVLFPQQHKQYQDSLELAVELAGGMVTPVFGAQVIEYDKAMKTAFDMAGVLLRNKGLATVCAVFNAMPKDQKAELLKTVLEKNPDYLKD